MKYALVTGGSRGIGRAICLELGNMGYHVLVNYQSNEEAARQTLQLISDNGGEGSLLPFDVSDRIQTRQVLENWLQQEDGRCIEVLVNNAGHRKDNLMLWQEDPDWDSVINTHLGGFYAVTQCLLKAMLRNKYGRIINIVSLSGLSGMAGQTNYSAAKGGIIAASKALAQEMARKNLTVNCIAPGFISTDMTQDLPEQDIKATIPMRRFGTPEEVAAVAGFLASSRASYVTGEVISVNGGLYM
ncbi:MAG: 3-oxoacyl-ACP reductase FabG [Saprospiraceae bacterium]|nr:3-oxoacyl-ACP reductase FabG [Saprospiraceae bacterium]